MANEISTHLGILADTRLTGTSTQSTTGLTTQDTTLADAQAAGLAGPNPTSGASLFSSSGTTINFNNFNFGGNAGLGCCCPCAPSPSDSTHPQGSLKVDDKGVVTTPGGYKIEATKQHEWIITGPDGKTTRIWGDPHVDEGDGGKWDFKRHSTFVLGDGTRINCQTKPWGNGMTVTDNLEIISGADRVQITGIADGKGKTGQVTHDAFAKGNYVGNHDVFVMGKESDDWSLQGKEIVGSNNGGESFKLGGELAAGWNPSGAATTNPGGPAGFVQDMMDIFFNIVKELRASFDEYKQDPVSTKDTKKSTQSYLDTLVNGGKAVGAMLQAVYDLYRLRDSIQPQPIRS